jgi:rhodanese-related sulfurtransferase
VSVANASAYLQVLRRARLVGADKRRLFVVYRLASPQVGALWRALRNVGAEQRAQVDRLVETYLTDRAALVPVSPEELTCLMAGERATVIDTQPASKTRRATLLVRAGYRPNKAEQHLGDLPDDCTIVACSRGPYGVMADEATSVLRQRGFRVRRLHPGYDDLPGFLVGGMAAWRRSGLPVEHIAMLTMRDLRQRIERGEPLVIVDVRQPHEWPTGHIPDAVLLEAGELPRADLHLPHDRMIATHCGHGERAATALSVLERRGYRQMGLVTGGVGDWRAAGGAVVTNGVSVPA